jgi:hypothetical protein
MHIAYNNPMKSSDIRSRLSHSQWSLKPQDLAVAFKLACHSGQRLPYATLSKAMHLSVFEAHSCVARLTSARLLAELNGDVKVIGSTFLPFVINGAAHFFPPVQGQITMGLPTAHAASPLKQHITNTDDLPPVWPYAEGQIRGASLLPLYPKLPFAALEDSNLYELLALFDALRIGQARERKIAKDLFEDRLG